MIRKLGFSHSCRLNWALVSHIAHSQKFPYEITVIRYDTIRLDWWHMTVSFRWQSSKFMQQIYISWDIRIIFRQQQHNTTKPHCCTYTANELASDMWDNNMPFTPPPSPHWLVPYRCLWAEAEWVFLHSPLVSKNMRLCRLSKRIIF